VQGLVLHQQSRLRLLWLLPVSVPVRPWAVKVLLVPLSRLAHSALLRLLPVQIPALVRLSPQLLLLMRQSSVKPLHLVRPMLHQVVLLLRQLRLVMHPQVPPQPVDQPLLLRLKLAMPVTVQ
jgi:hypothetical protein